MGKPITGRLHKTPGQEGWGHGLMLFRANSFPGDWFFSEDKDDPKIYIHFPKGGITSWPLRVPLRNGACWSFSGTREKPTIHPSMNLVGEFHGWLREGVLSEA